MAALGTEKKRRGILAQEESNTHLEFYSSFLILNSPLYTVKNERITKGDKFCRVHR